MDLKKAIVRKLKRENNLEYAPTDIVVSNGAKHSLMNIFTAILNPGDEVIVPAPYWVSYPEMVKLADGVPVSVDLREEDEFKLTKELLLSAITPKTKILVLAFPNNPTGAVMTREELEEIAKVVIEKDIFVVSDEIYAELTYGDITHCSIASIEGMKERTIVINGFSKAFSMTGWRL
jgi:aspartate/methionine/tyrosine aminotransferase